MRSRSGRGRGGPGLLGTMARTAVIAGTATAVSGKVSAAQQSAARQQAQAAGTASPTPPAATAGSLGVDEMYAQLTKLGELKQAGLLTDEEFARQKARLLGL